MLLVKPQVARPPCPTRFCYLSLAVGFAIYNQSRLLCDNVRRFDELHRLSPIKHLQRKTRANLGKTSTFYLFHVFYTVRFSTEAEGATKAR